MHNHYITPDDYKTAEQNGIKKGTVISRFNNYGWSKQRAITQPVQKQNNRKKWAKVAATNGIAYQSFLDRVNKMGWPEEKAATTPVMSRKEIAAKRRTLDTKYYELAKENGISNSVLRRRIRDGWSHHEASTRKPMTKSEAGTLGMKARFNKSKG